VQLKERKRARDMLGILILVMRSKTQYRWPDLKSNQVAYRVVSFVIIS